MENVKKGVMKRPKEPLLPRTDMIKSLKNDQFDVLIIGGGATGAGCALDSGNH